ncbi:MAG: hypothetical protein PVF68_05465 [Acidobacteriota bacterium]|jgi:hypothetical protein
MKSNAAAQPAAPVPPPTICCVGDSFALEHLMDRMPDPVIVLEPSPSRAMRLCLEQAGSRLVIDLASLGPDGLSALVQLRLLRPEQEIVLVGGAEDARHLDDSLLGGLPVIAVKRFPADAPRRPS